MVSPWTCGQGRVHTYEWARCRTRGVGPGPLGTGQAKSKHSLPPRGPTGLAKRSRGRRTELAQKLETEAGKQSPVNPTPCQFRALVPRRHRAARSQTLRSLGAES